MGNCKIYIVFFLLGIIIFYFHKNNNVEGLDNGNSDETTEIMNRLVNNFCTLYLYKRLRHQQMVQQFFLQYLQETEVVTVLIICIYHLHKKKVIYSTFPLTYLCYE